VFGAVVQVAQVPLELHSDSVYTLLVHVNQNLPATPSGLPPLGRTRQSVNLGKEAGPGPLPGQSCKPESCGVRPAAYSGMGLFIPDRQGGRRET
jgi:hypothetical protein